MENLQSLLAGKSISEARSALYYLSRYLKQAAHYERYKKDIFEDSQRSYPTESVQSLTKRLIEFIERSENASASQFDDATYVRWSDRIGEVESGLDPEPSAAEIERAESFVNTMRLPGVSET